MELATHIFIATIFEKSEKYLLNKLAYLEIQITSNLPENIKNEFLVMRKHIHQELDFRESQKQEFANF